MLFTSTLKIFESQTDIKKNDTKANTKKYHIFIMHSYHYHWVEKNNLFVITCGFWSGRLVKADGWGDELRQSSLEGDMT